MESERVNGATTEVIRSWFAKMAIPIIKSIKPANRYNVDEAGIMEGMGANGLVVGSRDKRVILRKQPGSRAWTSFIECISATGNFLYPLVIFRGKSVQKQWFPLNLKPYEGWHFTTTDNGWTTDETAVEWLQKVFIDATRPDNPSEPRLLILDGHHSHESIDFIWICFSNNVFLTYLPPHCSHVLQPLDLSVFSPLKTAYRKALGTLVQWTDSTVVGKRNLIECYRKGRLAALVPKTIRSGWKATRLWPVCISKPLISRLLVENANAATTPTNDTHLDVLEGPATLRLTSSSQLQPWTTPTKTTEMRTQLVKLTQQIKPTSTQRLLFQKVSKAFDNKDFDLALLQRENEALRAQLEAIKPRKRKKVKTSPNSKFANIKSIRKAQLEAGYVEDQSVESSASENPSEAVSCIVVASKRSKKRK